MRTIIFLTAFKSKYTFTKQFPKFYKYVVT